MPENDRQQKSNETIPFLERCVRTLFADHLHVSIRGDHMVLLRFMSYLPEGSVEEARVMIQLDNLPEMLDQLCAKVNHYPKKLEESDSIALVRRKRAKS